MASVSTTAVKGSLRMMIKESALARVSVMATLIATLVPKTQDGAQLAIKRATSQYLISLQASAFPMTTLIVMEVIVNATTLTRLL